ncbi:MAG: PPC domain-containing DNA-binding protein [Planctomycetota bacterium]|jgi:predicted DNA-binding protein with PD1-like motif
MKTTGFWLLTSVMIVFGPSGCHSQLENNSGGMGPSAKNKSDLGPSAPAVHSISSNFNRIVVARFKYGTDLLDGLKKAVKKERIKNAAILSGMGSLTSYHVHSVDNTTFPTKNVFFKAEAPQDLLNVNGYVIDGRVHAHITFSDEEKALGGHLEPGTSVFTFVIITLGVLEEDASLRRFDDKEW